MPEIYARDLDLNLLRVFAVVAEEGSITRAAARLYLTQPAVSAAMRRLTSFVGTELLARQGRGIILTSRGAELLAVARAHLPPLVAAATATPAFDPQASTATIRIGLTDSVEAVLLPGFCALLRSEAPRMKLVVCPIQFRSVEEALLTGKIELAVTVADQLSRAILRQPLPLGSESALAFVCLYDSRFARFPARISEKEYFAREHVIVSYAGDLRGVVEDLLGRAREVRVSVPGFEYVGRVVEGSPLLATVPGLCAPPILRAFPRLRSAALPFAIAQQSLDLLWSRVTDADSVARFVRSLVLRAARSVASRSPDGAARSRRS
jgi:LysR family transcriptional activator of mexEF-oprN operon